MDLHLYKESVQKILGIYKVYMYFVNHQMCCEHYGI